MKKSTFFKMFLVMAGLCTGNCVWADVTPFNESYSSESTIDGWATGTAGRFTPVILNDDDDYYLSVNQDQRNNNGATVTGTVVSGKAAAGDDFTITFDMKLSNSNNQASVSFTIKDAANTAAFFSLTATAASVSTFYINGTSTQITLPNDAAKGIADCVWCSYKITRSGENTYLTITNKETSETIFSQAAVSGSSETGGLGNMVFVTKRYNANFAIDNIVVRTVETADIPSTYTAVFTDNTSGNNVSGTTTIYSDSERSSVVANGSLEDGETYYYTTTQTNYYDYQGSFTVDGANPSVSFSMTRYPSYTVNATAGGTVLAQIASGYAAEGAAYSTYVPKAVKYNNQYYVLDDADNTNLSTYLASYTIGSTDEVKSINYTLDASIVFYAEYEDISTGVASYTYFEDRSSKGYSKALSGTSTMTTQMNTTSDGVYNVTIACGNRDNSHTATLNMKLKASDGTVSETNVLSVSMAASTWKGEQTANNVLVPAGSEFYVVGDGNTTNRFVADYIIVRKVADVTSVDNEFVGAFDCSTAENGVSSSDIVLKSGEAYTVSFQNHGTTAAYKNNFIVNISNGGSKIASMYADWYDYTNNKGGWDYYFTNPYSADGGTNGNTVAWNTFVNDMQNATVTLAISYVNGNVNILGTAPVDSRTYYWNYTYGDNAITGDVTINLSVCLAWLEILSVEQTAISATIGATGYSSFASAYALDFSSLPEGLTAYYASAVGASSVTLTQATGNVAAGEGLILKGTANATYSIPVVASGEAIDGNKLVGCTAATEVAANKYVLASNDGTAEFQYLSTALTIPAGKAYLDHDYTNNAKLRVIFDGDASGIEEIATEAAEDGVLYNVAGQVVTADYKGIVIKNGKKYLNQ